MSVRGVVGVPWPPHDIRNGVVRRPRASLGDLVQTRRTIAARLHKIAQRRYPQFVAPAPRLDLIGHAGAVVVTNRAVRVNDRRGSSNLVTTSRTLLADGLSRSQIAHEISTGRWRRHGFAVVLHNGPLGIDQVRRVAQIHAGPCAVFTAFTTAALVGLEGWDREAIHLLAPAGTRLRAGCPVPVRLHLHGRSPIRRMRNRPVEILPDALVRAAGTFRSARPACGLLAAAVQQRKLTAADLREALERVPRVRHRAELRAAVVDIAGGSEALSEIDFVRLCRRHGLPTPVRQAMRKDSTGRRRYLDATWLRPDGRAVVAEIDGALHLAPRRWWDDQLRQNELVIADALVLRFPSVVLRTEELLVVRQLRRALLA